MTTVNIHHLQYDTSDQSFSVEHSDLPSDVREEVVSACYNKRPIAIYNPKTRNTVAMTQFKVDTDSTHEDIYGWHYRGTHNGKTHELLIIND